MDVEEHRRCFDGSTPLEGYSLANLAALNELFTHNTLSQKRFLLV